MTLFPNERRSCATVLTYGPCSTQGTALPLEWDWAIISASTITDPLGTIYRAPLSMKSVTTIVISLAALLCAACSSPKPELPVADTVLLPGIEAVAFKLDNLELTPDGIVLGNRNTRLFRINPGGETIEQIAKFRQRINAIHVSSNGVLVVATDDGRFDPLAPAFVFVSHDGGHTFRQSLEIDGGTALAWSIDSNSDGTLYVGEYGPQIKSMSKNVWASHDDGNSWTKIFQAPDRDGVHVHRVAVDPRSQALWISIGDGADNRGLFVSESLSPPVFTKVADSQATAIAFTDDQVYLGEDDHRRPGITMLDRDATNPQEVLLLQEPGNFGGSIYDMAVGASGTVYAPTMKYADQSHVAALWVGRRNDWQTAMYFASASAAGGGRSSIAGPDTEGYLYVSGYRIHDKTLSDALNQP